MERLGNRKRSGQPARLRCICEVDTAAGLTFHQFVGRLGGSGGFAVVDTDNPMDLTDAPSEFGFFAEYQIHPVVDVAEAVEAFRQGVEFRESVS